MNPILKDCKVEVVDSRPYGGQQVGSTHGPVRVTHLPSGISVTIGVARSQMRNRNIAAEMIEWALLELNGRGM